ncbi:MAG TPA: hypothetical protein VE954_11615 [Oligoflexus sp.]|uniref:hypothetical protein n=1 Tax=Oligoflexus sp. TaxID=1971216 RepID=UPI002D6A3C83|nr:hypothetical protein [Oligoflexus sp.]HYX33752.1 hypothetical protein [Oligoflexus sp.]
MLLLRPSTCFLLPLWLTLVLVSCGERRVNYDSTSYAPPSNLHMDSELQGYFDSYVSDAAAAGVGIPDETLQEFKGLMWTDHIDIKNSPDATILCHCQRRHGLRFVELLKPNAEGKVGTTLVDDVTLKVMVYHELGHCLHDFSGHTSGKSAAVMNSYLQPARYFDLDGLLRDHFQMLKKVQDNPSFRP